jgi:predicted TIM-barrel fold metal-dependent hydrolase
MGVQRYFEFSFLPVQSFANVILRESDVFERYPGLKVIICHCGGFIERLGPGAQFRAKSRYHLDNLFYDTSAYDTDFIGLAIKQRGVSQFAFGTEAPGSGTELRPGTEFSADDLVPMFEGDPALAFLSEDDKIDILHDTPLRLFPGLDDAAGINARASVKAF